MEDGGSFTRWSSTGECPLSSWQGYMRYIHPPLMEKPWLDSDSYLNPFINRPRDAVSSLQPGPSAGGSPAVTVHGGRDDSPCLTAISLSYWPISRLAYDKHSAPRLDCQEAPMAPPRRRR